MAGGAAPIRAERHVPAPDRRARAARRTLLRATLSFIAGRRHDGRQRARGHRSHGGDSCAPHQLMVAAIRSVRASAVPDFLDLPQRPSKPRDQGVTHVIDTGLSTVEAEGLMASASEYVDLVRLGWGSAYVTSDVRAKVRRYQAAGVPVMLGGTLTELAWLRGKMPGLTAWLDELGIEHVEVSSGTVNMPPKDKLELIESLAGKYTV